MKRILSVLLLVFTVGHIYAQTTKTFDCGLFSFEYPISYKAVPITYAPHMVLLLENGNDSFSASYWDYDLDSETDIWDDRFVEYYKQVPVKDGKVICVSREHIYTKDGYAKCLKILSNAQICESGTSHNYKMVNYVMVKGEFLLVFCYGSIGSYTYGDRTLQTDILMKGLKLKGNYLKQ